MSIEEAIKRCNEVADECTVYFLTSEDKVTRIPSECAADHRQLANWLQELKERREKERRQIPQAMTEEACEAFINLTKEVIEILPDLIESATANMPEAIEQYIESKIRNGKEESK